MIISLDNDEEEDNSPLPPVQGFVANNRSGNIPCQEKIPKQIITKQETSDNLDRQNVDEVIEDFERQLNEI